MTAAVSPAVLRQFWTHTVPSSDPAECLAALLKRSTVMHEQSGSVCLGTLLRPQKDQESPYTFADICGQVHKRVYDFLDNPPADEFAKSTQERVRLGLAVIDEALTRYRLEEISFSYNGGKDCLVLLILYLAALHTYAQRESASTQGATTNGSTAPVLPDALPSVYIISPHPFVEIDEFVDSSSETYRLDLARYDMPMKEAFGAYLSAHAHVKAILVGTRRTDPHGTFLDDFNMTDSNWPSFMRVHPVLDWQYVDVWTFIRYLGIPYCSLYDRGYTSLGGTQDTAPNPVLMEKAAPHDQTPISFRPAYELLSDDAERLGRDT